MRKDGLIRVPKCFMPIKWSSQAPCPAVPAMGRMWIAEPWIPSARIAIKIMQMQPIPIVMTGTSSAIRTIMPIISNRDWVNLIATAATAAEVIPSPAAAAVATSAIESLQEFYSRNSTRTGTSIIPFSCPSFSNVSTAFLPISP